MELFLILMKSFWLVFQTEILCAIFPILFMEVFLLSIHYIQQTLSYIFHIELVSLKNIEILSNLGKSEFGQKRMPKYGHIFLSS